MIQEKGFQMKPNMSLLSDRNHQTVKKMLQQNVKRSNSTRVILPPPQDMLIS